MAMRFSRLVAGQIPTGWDAGRYGIPADIIAQTDRTTLRALVCAAEALNMCLLEALIHCLRRTSCFSSLRYVSTYLLGVPLVTGSKAGILEDAVSISIDYGVNSRTNGVYRLNFKL